MLIKEDIKLGQKVLCIKDFDTNKINSFKFNKNGIYRITKVHLPYSIEINKEWWFSVDTDYKNKNLDKHFDPYFYNYFMILECPY